MVEYFPISITFDTAMYPFMLREIKPKPRPRQLFAVGLVRICMVLVHEAGTTSQVYHLNLPPYLTTRGKLKRKLGKIDVSFSFLVFSFCRGNRYGMD